MRAGAGIAPHDELGCRCEAVLRRGFISLTRRTRIAVAATQRRHSNGSWSPECTGGRWLDHAAKPVLGAHFRGANRWGPVRWSTTCEIVAIEEGRHLAFDARHWSGATTRWAFELIPDGDGTVLRERFETRDSPSWVLLLDRLAGRPRRLMSSMKTTLQRLSHWAERALP